MVDARAVVDGYLEAVRTSDAAHIAAGFHPTATLATLGETVSGRDAIETWFSERADFRAGVDLHVEHIAVLGGFVRLDWWAGRPEGAVEGTDEFDVDHDGLITALRVVRAGPSKREPACVRIEFDPPIGRILLDRDAKRNAVSQSMLRIMIDAVASFVTDESIRAVVLGGVGRDFCAGEDVRGFEFSDTASAETFLEGPLEFFTALERLPKPVLVAVHGHALGFGSEVLLAADTVVAEPSSTLGFGEIDHGAVPSVLVTRGLDTTFRRRVLHLALTGERIGVHEALDARLVHVVAEDATDAAEKLAHEQAEWSRESVAVVKAQLGRHAADDHRQARIFMAPVLIQVTPAL